MATNINTSRTLTEDEFASYVTLEQLEHDLHQMVHEHFHPTIMDSNKQFDTLTDEQLAQCMTLEEFEDTLDCIVNRYFANCPVAV